MATTSVEIQETPEQPGQSADPSQHLFQFATAYIPSAALWVAAYLNIADYLRDGPLPVTELARYTETNHDALYRILRLLAMVGIFAETEPRHFALTPSAELLCTHVPNSLRDTIVWIADPFHFNIASHLLHSVKTGQPTVEHVTGKPAFEYFPTDAVEFERFHLAMTNMSNMAIHPALEVYDFSKFHTVVDVAGGHGQVLCSILQRYPHLRGILFDMEDVVLGAEKKVGSLGLEGRCKTVYGDFFQSVPKGGDLYFMKHIIHDWPDHRALIILRNCGTALQGQPHGKVVLLEFVVPGGNQPHPAKVIDIEMLFFPGGRERTEQEFAELFAQAGLRMTQVIPTKSPFNVIEAEAG
jgi:hypothetical protein